MLPLSTELLKRSECQPNPSPSISSGKASAEIAFSKVFHYLLWSEVKARKARSGGMKSVNSDSNAPAAIELPVRFKYQARFHLLPTQSRLEIALEEALSDFPLSALFLSLHERYQLVERPAGISRLRRYFEVSQYSPMNHSTFINYFRILGSSYSVCRRGRSGAVDHNT